MRYRLVGHRSFVAALACALVLRVLVMLGYRWQLWFPDSYGYVSAALRLGPGVIRPSGYSLMLWVLRSLHSFALVTALQHLMGLGIGVMVYALLRRNGLPGWGATLAAAPVLFDAYQVELEHLVLSDTLFAVLVMGAVTIALWRYQVNHWQAAATGLLLGLASVVRTVGLPLLAIFVVFVLARRFSWRVLAAMVAACALPIAVYGAWFTVDHHRLGLTGSNGIFLYGRTLSFANCSLIRPPGQEAKLCVPRSLAMRGASAVWSRDSPLRRMPGKVFAPYKERLAGDFAVRAIRAQPLAYVAAVGADMARTFRLGHPPFPDPLTYRYYLFRSHAIPLSANAERRFRAYGHESPVTGVVQPYAGLLRGYQRYAYLRGAAFGLVMAVGLLGLVSRWRRFGGRAALPWAVAAALVIIPPVTVEFDYRYVLPAVPPACVAAALALVRGRELIRSRLKSETPIRGPFRRPSLGRFIGAAAGGAGAGRGNSSRRA